MIYTVTLNPALDYYCTVESLKLGETNRCIREALIGGGKGINVSLMLAQLKVPTTALGFAAGFTGEELIRQLQAQAITADFIRCEKGQTRINVKISAEEETEINGRGPAVSAAEREALLEKIRGIRPQDTLVLSGNVPPTLPESIYLSQLEDSTIRVVVDAEGNLLKKTLRFHPFLIKPNLAELRQMVSNPQASLDDQIQELRQLGAQHVLVSMGAEGSVLFAADGSVYRQLPLSGEMISTVGAGDSMVAGFLASLENPSASFEESLRWAAACGTATAFSRGIAQRKQVEALLKQIQIEELSGQMPKISFPL